MPRNANPDFVVDPDRGSSPTVDTKQALLLHPGAHGERGQARSGLRELDAMVEAMSGLNRLQKDRERLFPRDTTGELGHPRMRRQLPDRTDLRRPLSSRQRNARSKDRIAAQASMPLTQLRAQRDLVTGAARWHTINDQLSDNTGDVQALPDGDQEQVRRVDRAIQAYERRNRRGHVLYSNVRIPDQVDPAGLAPLLRGAFTAGDRVTFDRYTAATHQLHETAAQLDDPRVAVVEIETRRGAYLGHSDRVDNTQHLLPRGMEFDVVGVHTADYTTPDGTLGSRVVIQLRDVTPPT